MFSEQELEYLTGQWVGRLSTSQPDGTLQVNPVGFGVNRALGSIDIGGYDMSGSRKYRNVLDNGRAAFVVDDVYSVEPWRVRFLEIRGHAEALGEPVDAQDQARFGPIIRVHPARIITLGLHPGDLDDAPHKIGSRGRRVA